MTDANALLKGGEQRKRADADVKRDRWGRYLIKDPFTGEEKAYTRTTTLAGALEDRFGLEAWDARNIIVGIGQREDLFARAASVKPEDIRDLNGIIKDAKAAAKAASSANMGTALHRFTERIEAGEKGLSVPSNFKRDVDAYLAEVARAELAPLPGWIERVVLCPQLDVAGTADRVYVRPPWRLPRIADLKTGKGDDKTGELVHGWLKIAIQEAIYANATHWFDPATGELHVMPELDKEKALVMHLPVGKATCTLYDVNIAAGWEAAQVAYDVRENWRKRKDWAFPIKVASPEVEPAPSPSQAPSGDAPTDDLLAERVQWVRDRMAAIIAAGHQEQLLDLWPDDTPTGGAVRRGEAAWAHEHVDRIAGTCNAIEMAHEMPFTEASVDPRDRPPRVEQPELPAEPLEPVTAPPPPPADHKANQDEVRAMLAEFGHDKDLKLAILGAANVDPNQWLTADDVARARAVINAVSDADGPLCFEPQEIEDGVTWFVDVRPESEAAMILAHHGRGAALKIAKEHAKANGIPVPRSLAKAAEHPLLVALTTTNQTKEPTT